MSRVLPILFNGDMVRAVLEGRKTVTRRVIPGRILEKYYDYDEYCNCVMAHDVPCIVMDEKSFFMEYTQYQPEDIIYVRETWIKLFYVDESGYTHFDEDMICYRADLKPDIRLVDEDGFEEEDQTIKWCPSIHMPKAAARIWLKVTDVRVERLQDISGGELLKEGIDKSLLFNGNVRNAFDKFAHLWDSTVKKPDLDRYGWDANPWVWVIEFERCEKPENKRRD